ncbi:hypothetical protein SAMN05216593_1113 [Pseudomonas asturiensis]|uniref:Uncharacterized protein n=1 Tax=Pseudomonas asturiensis TaxID=1190415 RepID=A0A1M7PIA7_9PSED|nr:hypothetical protein [Pseudomonas asturiensis]SHN16908.1 hypothetical protein SAMN05216593_1113 [Pseudomonas asturiensis]
MIQSITTWLKNFFVKTWQFFASVVVVIIVFISQFHDFKSPDMALEVTSVKATSSQPIDLIKLNELSSLKFIVSYGYPSIIPQREMEFSPEEIDRSLLIFKNRIISLSTEIEHTEKKLAFGFSGADQKTILNQLADLHDNDSTSYQRFFMSTASRSLSNSQESNTEKKIDSLKEKITDSLESKRRERDNLNIKYDQANKDWTEFKSTVMPSRTKLVITCAVGNQGSGATSLKPQALFRANLGEGNYLDFSMKMSDYDSSPEAATLQPQSYKVIKFESDEIQSMTAADRDRFKSFLGNASPARLFVSDVRGEVYESNSVPFSPGVYEQKMFDALKQFASSKTR